MREISAEALRSLATDISIELQALRRLATDIAVELDVTRVKHLVLRYPAVWQHVEADVVQFIAWLTTLAKGMASD